MKCPYCKNGTCTVPRERLTYKCPDCNGTGEAEDYSDWSVSGLVESIKDKANKNIKCLEVDNED